jgi:hypothetical protein
MVAVQLDKSDLRSPCAPRDSRSESELGVPPEVCPCSLYTEPETQKYLVPIIWNVRNTAVKNANSWNNKTRD